MTLDLTADIRTLAGVGSAKALLLNKLGINDIGSLLYHFPRAYEYRGNVKPVAAAQNGEVAAFVLTVTAPPSSARTKNGMTLYKLPATDGTGACSVTFFNQSYVKTALKPGGVYRFYGKVSRFGRQVELSSPVYEVFSDRLIPLFPVYPATEGMSSSQIHRLIASLIDRKDINIPENLPEDVIESEGLISRGEAIRAIHHPESFDQTVAAKRRLAYEEIYGFALEVYRRKTNTLKLPYADMKGCDCKPFTALLGFEPTNAQKRVMNEIYADLTHRTRSAPMRRMVSGDVGSGKTACAQFAAFVAIQNGYQAALMVPTEILAKQHYRDTAPLFEKLGKKVFLLTGETAAAKRKQIYAALEDGSCDLIIGTHTLITEKVKFKSLGLVICDEQHRFGVTQREALLNKGSGTHMLVMSATPIPRTLALVLFGDLDVSVIDEMPPGRIPVRTVYRDESAREKVYSFIRSQVRAGRQAYIVCPSVDEEEDDGLLPMDVINEKFSAESYGRQVKKRKAAVNYAEQLSESIFPDLRVGYIHGKMKNADKTAVMSAFEKNELDILVSTTVIEVGINVPNASVMLVENADCFGLSQLHQLRGRVGRGKYSSYCILMADSPGQTAESRLKLMERENNGYKIAEFDLKQRGPGDFIKDSDEKVRQHGALKMKIAGAMDDVQMLYRAFAAAEKHA